MRGEFRRPCIKAATKRDIVLPFAGSGTVGKVAIELGRKAILLDLSYHELARRRIAEAQPVLVVT